MNPFAARRAYERLVKTIAKAADAKAGRESAQPSSSRTICIMHLSVQAAVINMELCQ